MVSIPDWSKFQRLHDTQREPSNVSSLNKYYRQREEETIRQAENQGLLRTPTHDYIIQKCGQRPDGRYVKDISQLWLVRLCGVHLRKVGDLTYCINLRICIIHNNFLTKIDALSGCRHLLKLDLHSNQLTLLPSVAFWSGMRHLRFLHLHDNPLGKYENLQNLATCPNLIALTMYDTPLSLKRNYRHHVVNSIWSLKALDNFVIADEEIIEDAVFGAGFSAKHQAFRISLFYHTPNHYMYLDELRLIQEIESRINKILAHHSPVLIVQKYMRGYLTRKMFGRGNFKAKQSADMQISLVSSNMMIPPPPSSSPIPDTIQQGYQEPFPTPLDMAFVDLNGRGTPSEHRSGSPKKRKNLLINLSKLQAGTFSSLYEAEQIAIETILPQTPLEKSDSFIKKRGRRRRDKPQQKKMVKSVKQFFGPMVESVSTPEDEVQAQEDDEETPVTEYRLRGYRPNMMLIDPTTEMILSKQDAGRVVRDAEVEHHRKMQELPTPRVKAPSKKTMNNDQRIFSKVHGTMGMSCLFAVHQAYKDREKAEKTASKMEHILSMRDERDRAKERIKLYHDEKRTSTLKQRDLERAKTLEQLERREMMRLNYLDRRQELKNKSADLTRSYRKDYTFIAEFSNQHTSVSNALLRHDRQAKVEDQLQMRSDFVGNMSAAERDQKDVVKKYLEHRQLMRQTESAMARATLDTRMLQEVNDRMLEAKTRVAHQKARRDTVQAFYPLPVMTPVPSGSAPANISPGSRWETNMLIKEESRVGKHPTMVL